jgi:DNA-binding MarR family transcriptional regulator
VATAGEEAVEPAVLQIAEFCQSILDVGGSPKSQEAMLQSARVALPPSAFLLLRYLELAGPLTVSQLAEIVGLHPSTVSSQLRPLTSKKFVRRAVDTEDHRIVALSITMAGRSVCDRVRRAGAREWTVVLKGWTKEDRERLGILLQRAHADLFAMIHERVDSAEAKPA